ncbi:MAG: dipeptidase [Actinomycetota bacterium]|nr:dipeptidase [Actinomycetota bacterium]
MATAVDDGRLLELLRAAPLIDGHNDLLWELRQAREKARDKGAAGREPADVSRECPGMMTDLPRLRAGGVGGQFWSVYVPSDLPAATAVTATFEQIDALLTLVRRYPDRLEIARTANDVERVASTGKVASMIGVEGGHSIGCSLGTLRILAELGAGYLTLTHNDDTPWADSATGDRTHGGLTRFGEEVVRELNRCGVLVDLSHTSDDTMRQAIELSEAPVIFSHSSARALCDVSRDVPDDVIELVGRTGGVVMVTFVPSFLTPEGAVANGEAWDEAQRLRAEHLDDSEAVRAAMEAWFVANPDPPAAVSDVADHVDHIRGVAGIDHVGIGSDFDGTLSMPAGLDDVSCFPALFAELADRGYADEELTKIAGRNVLRVMREAEKVADRIQTERLSSTATIEQLDQR